MDKQSMTQEQYKIEVLKSRIGKLVSDYEDAIANQATEIATLKSQLAAWEDMDAEQDTSDSTN